MTTTIFIYFREADGSRTFVNGRMFWIHSGNNANLSTKLAPPTVLDTTVMGDW